MDAGIPKADVKLARLQSPELDSESLIAASPALITPETNVDAPGVDKDIEAAVGSVLCNNATAGLSAVELPASGTSASLEPQITIRMGNSLGQLPTNNAVLTALPLGGGGGCGEGTDWNRAGEVDARRKCD